MNLVFAALVLEARPRTLAYGWLAVLFATNGLATPAVKAALAAGSPEPWITLAGLLEAATLVPLLLLPLLLPSPRLRPAALQTLPWAAGTLYAVLAIGVLAQSGSPRTLPWTPFSLSIGALLRVALLLGVALFTLDLLTSRGAWRTAQARLYLAAYLAPVAALAAIESEAVRAALHAAAPGLYPPLEPSRWPEMQFVLGAAYLAILLVPFAVLGSAAARGTHPGGRAGAARDAALLALVAAVGFLLGSSGRVLDLAWSFVRPVLFVTAVFAFRVVDWGRHPSWLLPAAAVAAFASVLFASAAYLGERGADPASAIGLGVVAAVAVVLAAGWPIVAQRAPPRAASAEGARRLYRDAVEASLDEGAARPGAEEALRNLRGRLGLGEVDHLDVVAHVRGEGADGAAPLVAGRYRLLRALGEGGFGRVDLARDERMGREVVLKRAKTATREASERLRREARVLARLNHPHIVAIHDILEDPAGDVLVLEYVPGGALADRLAGPVSPGEARRWGAEILDALAAAHAHGVVHRDVKPANVLVGRDGRLLVADFGVAHEDGGGTGTAQGFTRPASQAGSVRSMAPEQVRGGRVDARADLYAVGALLYECVAGRPYLPFDGLADYEARLAILEDAPRPAPDACGPAWRAFLARALAKEPDRRFPDAATMRDELLALPAEATPLPGA